MWQVTDQRVTSCFGKFFRYIFQDTITLQKFQMVHSTRKYLAFAGTYCTLNNWFVLVDKESVVHITTYFSLCFHKIVFWNSMANLETIVLHVSIFFFSSSRELLSLSQQTIQEWKMWKCFSYSLPRLRCQQGHVPLTANAVPLWDHEMEWRYPGSSEF